MSPEEITALVQATCEGATRASVAAAREVVREMQTQQTQQATDNQAARSKPRKPELPAFDNRNIEMWIRRIESAYARAGVVTVKDKFAFLESNIGIDTDPVINEFLFGDDTDAQWTAFKEHLLERYGKTKQQRAQVFLDGIKRDGKRPSAAFSVMKEKMGDITLEDLMKQQILNMLPAEIQLQMEKDLTEKDLTAAETAKLADYYYDRDGHVKHSTTTTGVNHLGSSDSSSTASASASAAPSFTTPFDDNSDINAVRFRQQQKQTAYRGGTAPRGRGNPAPRARGSYSNSNSSRRDAPGNANRYGSKDSSSKLKNGECHFHVKFGDQAYTCEPGCKHYAKMEALKGKASYRA